ncbi:hemagglutinin/amebocyte aggregation factor-like [Acropora palmata]|uniref:hemagglutinin/amebocyte aggregation factor-like n=1 Tax=Acropora palmata TaxID=6131 RepID=UPI003DA03366
MTMKGSKLALLFLLVVALEILLFKGSDADPWWRRRRRRRHVSPSCSSSRPSSPRWVNSWQKNFNVRCPNKYSIFVWLSQHRNCKGDRIYYFQCKNGPFVDQHWRCSSSPYVNQYDRQLVFKCANNGVIAGVKSTYSYGAKDRRFSFRCCHIPGHIAHTCKHTAIQNKWDQPMRYVVPKDYYMVGAFSEHENSNEDRTWIFEICRFGKAC